MVKQIYTSSLCVCVCVCYYYYFRFALSMKRFGIAFIVICCLFSIA